MSDCSSHAALDAESRLKKARKIEYLLGECGLAPIRGRMLEVGAGSGIISEYFASKYKGVLSVDAIDVADQRVTAANFHFQTYDGRKLPFDDEQFDLVVSNHVIEHVGSRETQLAHMGELARVLSLDGMIYLAAPSRWQWREPHFGLPALSWVPPFMRNAYVRVSGRGDRYDCNPMGHRELERMAARCGLKAHNLNAQAIRAILGTENNRGISGALVQRISPAWLKAMYRVSPTMIYVLTHGAD